MGVAGLWEVLRPAGQVRSLTELAVEDGFNANPSYQRGFRIGVDASIWFFHATYGREGENPELRTLFFRCCRLLQSPLLPLFVFDGPNRPAIKRGKRVGANAHWLTQGMKNIIDAFGFEWWVAPGEAEAELAYLNRIGIIDAVLSDDGDNFLFGATMVIRNPSNTLSGNRAHSVKNAQGKDDGNHVVAYTVDAILSDPSVALSRPGTILIGLLSGGDYIPAGLPGCGQKFAAGLARAGFGDSLFKAVKELRGARLDAFLDQWRQDIRNELKTNKSGLLPSKKPSLAASLPDDFPSLPVLMSYADPLTTENSSQKGKRRTPPGVWRNDPDPMRITSLCELYFEWGVKDVILHRFRTVLWPGIVCRAVRRAVMDMDEDTRRCPILDGGCRPDSEEEGTAGPSSPMKRISSTLSGLALSSPPKKPSATSNSSESESFTLSSLVPLTSPASPSLPRSSSPSSPSSPASGPSPLLLEVLSQRTHTSTDATLEYRVLVDPTALVERAERGINGLRPPLVGGLFGIDPEDDDGGTFDQDESGSDGGIERLETAASQPGAKKRKARRVVPTTLLRLWLPACMMRAAVPALVEVYEEKVRAREEKKAKRGTKGGRGGRAGTGVKSASRRTQVNGTLDDDDDESVPGASATKTTAVSKAKPRAARIGRGRRKPKQASEAQDDAYEYFELSAGESPCSSDEDGVRENRKGITKAMVGQMDVVKPSIKAGAKTDATHRRATTTNAMKQSFKTTKPSTMRATKTKPSTSQAPAVMPSTSNPAASKRSFEKEEEEESTDVDNPPPLLNSSRPLDVLRAKSKSSIVFLKSKSKPTVIPRYEEKESPSSSSSPRLSGPCWLTEPAPQARKKPLFVNVSDTDSDIEVRNVRRPLSGTTATITGHDQVDGDVHGRIGVGKNLSTLKYQKALHSVVGGAIDLRAKGNASRCPSTSVPTVSRPPERSLSTPLVTGTCTTSGPGVNTSTIDPTSIVRSPSKLGLRSQLALESEEEGSEGDELPTFHHGSIKSGTKKATTATNSRPVLRPFPMQLASESPVSYCASRLKESEKGRQDDENDDGDGVEIVDVFTTPRGPSPPRSPTPSPSPVKPLSGHSSAGSATLVKSKQSGEFPTSPTSSTCKHKRTKSRRRVSLDRNTHVSGNERNAILKSPRKSAAHSSPRHIPRSHGRASSPTPPALSHTSRNAVLWTGGEGYRASDYRGPRPENPRSTYTGDGVGRKPRPSDTSAIYISSGSEDEDSAGLDNNRGGGEAEVNQDLDEWTDQDVDGWADTGMILSAPPSLASPSPASEFTPSIPVVEVLPNPTRASRFKSAPTVISQVVAAGAPSAEIQTSDRATPMSLKDMTHDEETVHRAPLLVARARRSNGRDADVIDLTSD